MADQSYLVKIVFIMHNTCSEADFAHNYANRFKAEQGLNKFSSFKQIDGWTLASY